MKLLSKLLLFFALILCWNTALQAQEIVAIWEKGKMPNHQISDEKEEVVINNITHIKKVQNPTLEIYLPTKQNANGKAVLILPGGDMETCRTTGKEPIMRNGLTVRV